MTEAAATGYVYIVGDDLGHVKIGWTRNFKARLRALQTAQPGPLRVDGIYLATPALERHLHKVAAEWRMHGEWFYAEGEGFWDAVREGLAGREDCRVAA